jgi:hypothetical protein
LIDPGLIMEQHDDTRCDLCGAPLRQPAESCLCWRCLSAQVIGPAPEHTPGPPGQDPSHERDEATY